MRALVLLIALLTEASAHAQLLPSARGDRRLLRVGRPIAPRLGIPQAAELACTVESSATTNYAKTSQDLFSGEWAAVSSGPSIPTLGNNTSFAPTCAESHNVPGCGLETADRLQVPATPTAGQYSFIYQSGCPNAVHSTGWWVCGTRGGVSETGTVDIYTGGGDPNGSFRCSFSKCPASLGEAGWTRCTQNNSAAGTTLAIGNHTGLDPIGVARAALDIQIWQSDCQSNATIAPELLTAATSEYRDAGCVGARRVLAGMGDSITLASGTGLNPLPVRVAYLLGDNHYQYAWHQGGVAGDTCAQVLARWPAAVAAGATHMFLHCGVNDARTGVTAAAAWSSQAAILNDALARGIKPRLVLTLNFKNAADSDAAKVQMINDLNVLQLAWCTAHGLACADAPAAMETADVLDNHQGDFLHPDTTGSLELADVIVGVGGTWPQRSAEGW